LKPNAKINFRNKEIKILKNEHLNLYEGNGGGFAPMRREIKYSMSSCGDCL
jgi:hypothetical protein